MGFLVLDNVRLFFGGVDLTGVSNKVELTTDVEEKDITTFASEGWKQVMGGLHSSLVAAEGFWEAGDNAKVDDDTFASLGSVEGYTLCPDSADVGDLAWLTKALRYTYKLGGTVGDVAPWTATASGSWPMARGVVLHPPGTARTATGDGTAVEHVAVSSGQYLYATLHVLSVSGTNTPTITVIVESDADSDFDGSETTRISFDAATAVGSQIKRVAGPITDDTYRASWTISGDNPSFLFVVGLGIK